MTEEAMVYLDEALDYIENHSIMRERIEWQALRQEAFVLVAHAKLPSETYPAIRMVLDRLGDHHSYFRDPSEEQLLQKGKTQQVGLRAIYPEGIIGLVASGSPAEQAGLQVGDRIESINGQLITNLTFEQFQRAFKNMQLDLILTSVGKDATHLFHLQPASYFQGRVPQGQQLAHNIGYLDLPGLSSGPEQAKAYAEIAQQLISEMDQVSASGWVIDLRRDTGGNMWPMIAGVGPILGEGEWFPFVLPLEQEAAFYRNGQAGVLPLNVLSEVDVPYHLKCPQPPVAILTSQLTASAGEFVALAFRGRSRTRSFGEPTYGVPTGNDDKELSDGAVILLTDCLGADRVGQTYNGPLLPDYFVKIDWMQLGTADDPVLQAAVQWLHTEEGCI